MADTEQFNFEKLEAYQVAKVALVRVLAQRDALRGLPGEIRMQLERAAVSAVANTAEGAGRQSRADQRGRYAIARAEANEAAAMIELAAIHGALDETEHQALRSSYLRLTRMLTGLIRR